MFNYPPQDAAVKRAIAYNGYVSPTPLSLQVKSRAYVLLANLSPWRDDLVSERVWRTR